MQDIPMTYEGHEPYIFVSYAHADNRTAWRIIAALESAGYRVWYDAGIEVGSDYADYIANRVLGCNCFIPLFSRASIRSTWCEYELKYALDNKKTIVPVYLEEVELKHGLALRLGSIQALFCFQHPSCEAFCAALFGASALNACLTPGGAQQRGADPWGDLERISWTGTGPQTGAVAFGDYKRPNRLDVSPKSELADYSWAELKEISRRIAEAPSGWDGRVIARTFNLVDSEGRLGGEPKIKPLELDDGTKTAVRIAGFRHDKLADGDSLSGITFEFADVPATHRMNSRLTNAGGWKKSGMRFWLNTEFLALLPDDLRDRIVKVKKKSNNVGEVAQKNDASVVTITDDKLWLLSVSEVFGKLSGQTKNVPGSPATYDAEGTQYKLYEDQGVTTTSFDFCKKGGADSVWWLRSPRAYDSWSFHCVLGGGDWYWLGGDAIHEWGVSPGFCF